MIYINLCVSIYVYIFIHMYTYIHIHTYVYIYVYIYIHIYVYEWSYHSNMIIIIDFRQDVHTYIYIYTYTRTTIYIYIYTYTHTLTLPHNQHVQMISLSSFRTVLFQRQPKRVVERAHGGSFWGWCMHDVTSLVTAKVSPLIAAIPWDSWPGSIHIACLRASVSSHRTTNASARVCTQEDEPGISTPRLHIEWCCLYYSIRNSSVALLESSLLI